MAYALPDTTLVFILALARLEFRFLCFSFPPIDAEISSTLCCFRDTLLQNAPIILKQSEVYVSWGAGAADHLTGAHHALLSYSERGQRAVPGLIRRGVGRGDQDLHLHPAGLRGVQ